MSKSLDMLSVAVTDTARTSADKAMTKDNLIDLISETAGYLSNAAGFFDCLGENSAKLLGYIENNRNDTAKKSIVYYNQIVRQLSGLSLKAMNDRFLGAFVDTIAGFRAICDELQENLDKLFTDKRITIYNTKISHVAIYGMLNNAKVFAEFTNNFIALFMSDRSDALPKPAPYVTNFIGGNIDLVAETMNRMLNLKLGKTFTAAIIKYRSSGSDSSVINSSNQATVGFAKTNNEVTDADIKFGAKGLKIFKMIGDWWTDRQDRANRKRRLERDILQARARLLQLELDGMDQTGNDYKRQVKIIENYQKMIDRLNQEIEKYEKS